MNLIMILMVIKVIVIIMKITMAMTILIIKMILIIVIYIFVASLTRSPRSLCFLCSKQHSLLSQKHNVGWFLLIRFVDLVRLCRNHLNTFLLIMSILVNANKQVATHSSSSIWGISLVNFPSLRHVYR